MIHVALDLGSESMAAFYYDLDSGGSGMINLQAKAEELLKIDNNGTLPDTVWYLEEKAENGRLRHSPRLRNHILLRTEAQPPEPDLAHARLRFGGSNNGSYKSSLFMYFHITNATAAGNVLPNPKILFQHQLKEILPKNVDSNVAGQKVNLTPEMLVKHLSLQVILNFILDSAELRGRREQDIHLTITVPNIYSFTHAESLKQFVRENTDVGEVDILSESDAVAYYVLDEDDAHHPQELIDFKTRLGDSFDKRKKVCLITLDIGKGTTDLSCILVEEPEGDGRALGGFFGHWFRKPAPDGDGVKSVNKPHNLHSVQGKTGRCSGGNYLNYIFARYYNWRLRAAASAIEKATGLKVPFGFLIKTGREKEFYQYRVLVELEELIEQVKRSITEDYEVELGAEEQRAYIERVADIMHENAVADQNADGGKLEKFRELLVGALTLPPTLGESRSAFSLLNLLGPRRRKASGGEVPSREETERLRRDLEGYVKENVDDLLESLKHLVKEHQAVERGDEIDRNTFVVVSGQASQFRPIRQSVRDKCKEMQIPPAQQYMMSGIASKEACCRGVISYRKMNVTHVNPKELHGTYGCLNASRLGPRFLPFDMAELRNGGKSQVSFPAAQQYYVVFTPRSRKEVEAKAPLRNDGATAFIKAFPDTADFEMKYLREELRLMVNDEELHFAGFGDVSESIYPKVWPEVLKPEQH